VNLEDLTSFDEQLAGGLISQPSLVLPLFSRATNEVLMKTRPEEIDNMETENEGITEANVEIQVLFHSNQNHLPIRNLVVRESKVILTV
jgi:DNA replicative helicase MCM subunit Mcm2 (Cdc46/Mcm family)